MNHFFSVYTEKNVHTEKMVPKRCLWDPFSLRGGLKLTESGGARLIKLNTVMMRGHFFSVHTEKKWSGKPARGPPKASQITSRPGSAGMSFWPQMMKNTLFYKGF